MIYSLVDSTDPGYLRFQCNPRRRDMRGVACPRRSSAASGHAVGRRSGAPCPGAWRAPTRRLPSPAVGLGGQLTHPRTGS
eukprot:scaffold29236_cov120-Isochrysis_galbana.AAC.2